jgi:glycosyltransferase involved in cell wall biosynthesis
MHAAISSPEPRLLAVIVCAYNLEHYIGACLESIAGQCGAEIEIVVVDDGSTDLTVQQIETVMRAHPECAIQLISQQNRGVSEARNRGISAAHARYLTFVDGDDLWTPDFCARVLPVLRLGDADLVEFDVEVIDDAGTPVDHIAIVPQHRTGLFAVDECVLNDYVEIYQAFVWARVYRASLWRNLRFPAGRCYEDNATLPYLYLLAHTVYRIDQPLYRYRRRSGSITSLASLATVRDLALNVQEALVHSKDVLHGGFWLRLSGRFFEHACSQAARVDARDYPAALQIVADLARRYRQAQPGDADAPTPSAIAAYTWRVPLERGVFRVKRAVKRLLGRTLQPRLRLEPSGPRAAIRRGP